MGHAAVRPKYTVHTERTDKLFNRLKAARLDHTYDEEMRQPHRIEPLMLDDPAPHPAGYVADQRLLPTDRGTPPAGLHHPPTGSRRRSTDIMPATAPMTVLLPGSPLKALSQLPVDQVLPNRVGAI
ncbi:hypothetical protein [Amycolatopsis sp.]|uniref:hypothetical protein n=1 Tax=Amycolatopsis sp. TaxID=37632 RepID=UPI0039C86118